MRTYEPRGAARDFLLAREGTVLISGPAGTGKSLAALYKMHMTAALVPNLRGLILRQTHTSLTSSTLVTFEQQVAVQELAEGKVKWFGGSGRKPPAYQYPNGSEVLVGGLDKPGKLLSTEYDRVFVDEANQVSITAVETLLTRLRGNAATYKQLSLACNPDHPQHHLKVAADEGKLRMLYSLHRDNPRFVNLDGTLTPDGVDYMAKLDALTGVRRLRYRDGIWAAAEGLVFDDWRDADNVVDQLPDMTGWPLLLTVDFGFSNPFVCQWWRIDPDGRMWLTREIHQTQVLVEDHARRIKSIMEANPDEPRPIAVVCDHDAEDRATLTRHLGLPTVAARKAVSRGVQLTQSRIRKAGDGRPRLYVYRHAVLGRDDIGEAQKRPRGFLGEVNGYVWQTERGADGIPKEVPVKLNDHSMDAGRYAVAHLDWHEAGKVGNPAAQREAAPASNSAWSRPVGR
ncbi:terminase [Streptomyces phage Xkcd426]|nr:terminase [Streptomyces phage Xkcd426]